MIRIKGDIIKQLNELYPTISFKIKYKKEIKERILIFVNKIFSGNLVEQLNLSKEYCIIENNEIKSLTKKFIDENKDLLFNSFNPLWYKINNKKEKIEIKIEEEKEQYEIMKIFLAYYINSFCKSSLLNKENYNELLKKDFFDSYERFNGGILKKKKIYRNLIKLTEQNNYYDIENIFNYNEKIINNITEINMDTFKKIIEKVIFNLNIQQNRFEWFLIKIRKKEEKLFYTEFECIEERAVINTMLEEKECKLFLDKHYNINILEENNRNNFDIFEKRYKLSSFLIIKIEELRKKRKLIEYLILKLKEIKKSELFFILKQSNYIKGKEL